jgi:hypothetical protein
MLAHRPDPAHVVGRSFAWSNTMARPTLYDPAYCGEIVEHCKTGASITSFAASIGVCRDTITNWGNDHPEFLAAVKRAKAAAAAWYDEQSRKIVGGAQGNATLCIFGLKNFAPDDFRDVQEQKHSGEVTVNKITREFVSPSHPNG